jgi:CPA2 family monovalent cation:H+ antiporter-2
LSLSSSKLSQKTSLRQVEEELLPTHDFGLVFIELGLAIIGLAVLARIASHWSISSIPLYLLAGLAFGNGGLVPLKLSAGFIQIGAEVGVLLLLFMLGLEYSGEQLKQNLQRGLPAGAIDLLLNFPPGFIAGLLLGWKPLPSLLLGGITYISSSSIIARVLSELRGFDSRETPTVLSILVLEDLVMAVYLPLVAVLISGGGTAGMLVPIAVAAGTVVLVLFVAIRYGNSLSVFVASIRRDHPSDHVRNGPASRGYRAETPDLSRHRGVSCWNCGLWSYRGAITPSLRSVT